MRVKVISGGQTGADQGALRAARAAGLETGGWAPRGWKTETGPAPWLAGWGLREHASSGYPTRTRANVSDADATLVFDATVGADLSAGTDLAYRQCAILGRPFRCALLDYTATGVLTLAAAGIPPAQIAEWLVEHKVAVLNVGGNRESKAPGVGRFAERYMAEVFRLLRTGGRRRW